MAKETPKIALAPNLAKQWFRYPKSPTASHPCSVCHPNPTGIDRFQFAWSRQIVFESKLVQ
jgi:hypothetical protein